MKKTIDKKYVRTKISQARRLEISRVTLDKFLSLPGAPERTRTSVSQ